MIVISVYKTIKLQPLFQRWKAEREYCMAKFVCTVCGYIYDEEVGDPDNGIEPGTLFADLPDDWECPLCSVGKEDFEEEA